MNLAEFPIAVLGKRNPNQKSIIFEDTIRDPSTQENITRRLTITGTEEFGLPTSGDEEILLALIQLSAQNNFQSTRVNFTRTEILKLLGWKHNGQNIKRIEDSITRWGGVFLHYENAWWDALNQSWRTENFHIFSRSSVLSNESRLISLKNRSKNPTAGQSYIVWNEVIFNSFQAGYIKKIDFEFYKSLETPISKRMYRFLDKRLYRKKEQYFNLKLLAKDHLGLTETNRVASIKQRLEGALKELEKKGFLVPLTTEERYIKQRGEWFIRFIKSASGELKEELPENPGCEDEWKNEASTPETNTVPLFSSQQKSAKEKLFDAAGDDPRSLTVLERALGKRIRTP